MAHGQRQDDLYQEIKKALTAMERFGEPKHEAKATGEAKSGIYSYGTARVYHRECQRFASYVAAESPQGRFTSLESARGYAKAYIEHEAADADKSAYTLKLERSALAKLFRLDGRELGEVRERARADITRSRRRTMVSAKTGKIIKCASTRAGRFSEKQHPDEVAFARGTGMRRSEMEAVRGDQLHEAADGTYFFAMEGLQCKGGRPRRIPVRGDVDLIKALCERAGSGRVFGKVPAHMDVHLYRAEYASALYGELARDTIPAKDRYYCRKDLKGTWYDKVAMHGVSEALGHSRVSVIAEHYLRGGATHGV